VLLPEMILPGVVGRSRAHRTVALSTADQCYTVGTYTMRLTTAARNYLATALGELGTEQH